MSRSLKKGPYIHYKLEKRVLDNVETGKKTVIKTWSRASMISPDFVGQTIAVHNGNKFIPVYVTENIDFYSKIEYNTNWMSRSTKFECLILITERRIIHG